MSDTDDHEFSIAGDGRYARGNDSYTSWSSKSHSLESSLDIRASTQHYLTPGGVWGGLSIASGLGYRESVYEHNWGDDQDSNETYHGYSWCRVGAETGVGRVRDVTPIVRAQRISERLKALGRPGLTKAQVRRVADILAREWGYRKVFDRAEKNFWNDVLEPVLADQAPLTPFEILYLRDVMVESLGPREQGSRIGLVARHVFSDEIGDTEAGVTGRWAHNFSLAHQLVARAYAVYSWNRSDHWRSDYFRASVRLEHLWILADRYDMRTTVLYNNDRYMPSEAANRLIHFVSIQPQFRIYIEDSLALVTAAQIDYSSRRIRDESWLEHGWHWSYRISLEYALDRILN